MSHVAVLLAAYNGEKWLQEQLESIFSQSEVTLHIYVSVDVSSDNTYPWLKSQEEIHTNMTVLSYGERFGGAAKNFFRLIRDVDFSSYDYVALADQDDIWLQTKLEHAVSTMEANHLDAFSSDVVAFWSDGREKLVKKSYPQKQYDYFFEAAGPGCTYVFTKASLEQFKLFLIKNWLKITEITLHDWLIYSFYRKNKFIWHIDSVPLMRYRQHDTNQVGFNSGYKATITRLVKVRDKWYADQVSRIIGLVSLKDDAIRNANRMFLITHFWQLRRRPRDAFALLIMLITGLY